MQFWVKTESDKGLNRVMVDMVGGHNQEVKLAGQ